MKKLLLNGGGHSHVAVMRGFGLRSAADISVTVVMAETAAMLVDEVLPEQPLRTATNGIRPCLLPLHGHGASSAFGIDVKTCTGCGGAMCIIARIEDPVVIKAGAWW